MTVSELPVSIGADWKSVQNRYIRCMAENGAAVVGNAHSQAITPTAASTAACAREKQAMQAAYQSAGFKRDGARDAAVWASAWKCVSDSGDVGMAFVAGVHTLTWTDPEVASVVKACLEKNGLTYTTDPVLS